jgi:hypothetical protein
MRLPVLIGLSTLMLTACVQRKITAPVAAAPAAVKWPVRSPDFVDLVPGSVREVTPIFASGGFVAKGPEQQNGNVITLTGTDFEGYETALYALKPRDGGGVEVRLDSVETSKSGRTAIEAKPRVLLFQFPRRVRYMRLLYLIRVSGADP